MRISESSLPSVRSADPAIVWPAITADWDSMLLAIGYQLDHSQWWSAAALRSHQMAQLGALLTHAFETVPFYRARLAALSYRPGMAITEEFWAALPILERGEVQAQGEGLRSGAVPPSHGAVSPCVTSGSTGMAVKTYKTVLSELFWQAITLREENWQRRDLDGTLAVIRNDPLNAAPYPSGRSLADWGPPVARLYPTGPAAVLEVHCAIAEQAEWLVRHNPDYLLTFATNGRFLAQYCRDHGLALPRLRGVRSFGEVVDPQTRRVWRETYNLSIADMYSAEEVGYIALQCPQHEHFHVQSEVVLVEILNDAGRSCSAGETGRVVVTPLHGFATPLIRYALGDYAEVGPPCPCGRGLPVLNRILGRERSMATLPSGEKRFLSFDFDEPIAALIQYQVVQKSLKEIEVKLVARRPLVPAEEAIMRNLICTSLGYEFRIRFTYVGEVPRMPGGKYFDFVSEIPA